ncbi:MAG: hypothetical protein LBH16_06315 [Treponema sp.]|jgi:hypothetical protein|nr:hypothetical protein [Treponema sp.]
MIEKTPCWAVKDSKTSNNGSSVLLKLGGVCTANSKLNASAQQAAGSRQQAAGSRQQANYTHSLKTAATI